MKGYIIEHYKRCPRMEIQDMVKMIYQNEFGPGHMITDQAASLERLRRELENVEGESGKTLPSPYFEPLGNGLCRLHLKDAGNWFRIETINRFFTLTAQRAEGTKEGFERKLNLLLELCRDGMLPYPEKEVSKYLAAYRDSGYPAVSHTAAYRESCRPAYRVVSDEYRRYWEIFSRIDKGSPRIIGIDGKSGSGKSSLGRLIGEVYDCNLFHMDDFFLRPEQRTEKRLSETGGNVDYERFKKQIMDPLLKRVPEFTYQIYDCRVQKLTEAIAVQARTLSVVEGSYSCHPFLVDGYGLKVFLDIGSETQRERIRKRNGEQMLQRFLKEWIPKENTYFEEFKIREQCDLTY